MSRTNLTITILAFWVGPFHGAPPQQPADMTVQHPAAIVSILGDDYLVHELWITNRLPVAATMDSVFVLDGARIVFRHEGAQLQRHVGRPDLPRNHATPLLLESGQRAVVYFWIPLSRTTARPASLNHRAALTLSESSQSPRHVVVTGGEASASAPADVEVLEAPLRGGGWAAIYDPSMIGGHRTAVYHTDGTDRIPGRFAIDFIRLLPSGRAHTDTASRPEDWNGFGAEVLAVRNARVAAAVNGRPDADRSGKPRETITRENAAGNYIALDLGNGRFAFYEHLQQGSVRVKVGDQVVSGQPIARVGSSGSVSSGPHLHFHVSDDNSLLGAEGVPFVLRQFRQTGSFGSIAAFARGDAPLPNAPGTDARRLLERPGPNTVVEFAETRQSPELRFD
jgi:murein DD-endopeptidase